MKNVLFSVILLMLTAAISADVSAQITKQKGIQKSSDNLAVNKDESVGFNRIEAVSDGNGVLIKWETTFENDNLGFNIFRLNGRSAVKVNRNLVPGTYLRIGNNPKQGDQYVFFDPEGTFNSVYRIENFSIGKRNHASPLFYPRFENNLVNAGAASSEALQRASREARPVRVEKNPVLPDELKNEIAAASLPADFETQRWVAAQPGVKIGVREQGIYRVTVAELQAAGFDTNADSDNWQLYLNGIEQAINVIDGEYIEFYGNGVDTIDTEINIYFLVVGNQAGKRMGNTIRRGIGGNVIGRNYEYSLFRKERSIYVSTVLNGNTENFFGGVISNTTPAVVNFDLSGLDFSTAKATMEVTIQGLTLSAHSVRVRINGETLDNVNGTNRNLFSASLGIPLAFLQNGTNTIEFLSLGGPSDINLVGSIGLKFLRLYEADDNELSFYTRNLRYTEVGGFTSPNVRVFDVTFPDAPTLITNASIEPTNKEGTQYMVGLPAHRLRQMFAVEDSAVKQAHSIVANNPSTLSATENEAELVIITHGDWLTEANVWAQYRENDGFSVVVADVQDVFDEFDYGLDGSKAISQFLQYTQSNWQTAPDYVFLMGDATFDPKNYSGEGFHSYIPIRLVDTLYEETGSDEAMADFNNDGLSEVAVGRITARVPQDVTDIYNKVVSFEADIDQAPARGSLCASDNPIGYDFGQLCNTVQSQLPGSIPTSHINRSDVNARTNLLAAMSEGRYLVNYSGHGSTGFWAVNGFFNINDAAALTNQEDLSIFTMLTCLNGYFIRPVTDSLSETLMKSNGGGAVATWSSSGSTTPDVQQVMATRFFNQLGNNQNMSRIGDLVQDAKANLVGGADVRRSWVLLGDPTLKVK
jgi:hypothetical protein